MLELPELKEARKVKSMQMFRKNVRQVSAGDRAGICVAGLDASKIERSIACAPQTVTTFNVRKRSACLPACMLCLRGWFDTCFFQHSGCNCLD